MTRPPAAPALFFRLLPYADKAAALDETVAAACAGVPHPAVFAVDPAAFAQVPGSPFAYWAPDSFIELFRSQNKFENEERIARVGLSTSDDFRFLRAFWEVPSERIARSREGTLLGQRWVTFCKGGIFSPYYSELYLMVDWKNDGKVLKEFMRGKGDSPSRSIRSESRYFIPGLTWPLRASRFAPYVLPEGSIFGVRGYAVQAPIEQLPFLLGILNSTPFDFLFKLCLGRFEFPEFIVGILQQLPIPSNLLERSTELTRIAIHCIEIKRALGNSNETTHVFQLPILTLGAPSLAVGVAAWRSRLEAAARDLAVQQRAIDTIAYNLYGIADADRQTIETSLRGEIPRFARNDDFAQSDIARHPERSEGSLPRDDGDMQNDEESNADESEDAAPPADARALVADLLSYFVGCALGRWDIRYATGEKPAPELPDPFAPLPLCPPGMLQNAQGLPAAPEDVPAEYPLRISCPGILVDDPGHPEDIEGRVRDALRVIWQDRADAIEQEACQILGVASLRAYFAAPARFFDDHLKRYSKSRRAAPIYWPLSTPSGRYTLWLYYHRLTDQALYTCVNDFVDPKLSAVSGQLSALRQKEGRSAQEERELEQVTELEQELQTFRDELLRLAPLWKPNLNDGVQITAAPLWRLFPHRGWQQRLRETWGKLTAGEYDWAHLALSLWPERVIPACAQDRSFAIAHDLEDRFWVEDTDGWRTIRAPEEELAAQQQRHRRPAREHLRDLLTALAAGEAKGLPAYQVCQHLAEGHWDDLPVAALLWPERVAEKCWELPLLSQQLAVPLPKRRTEAGQKRIVKQLLAAGCPDLADAFVQAFKDAEAPFDQVWAELTRGVRDHEPLALALWPDRVVEKCAADPDLAARHELRRCFWYRRPDGPWQRRQTLRREIADEIARRK